MQHLKTVLVEEHVPINLKILISLHTILDVGYLIATYFKF